MNIYGYTLLYINFSKDLERRTRGHFGPTKFLFLSSIPFPVVSRGTQLFKVSSAGNQLFLTQAFNVASPAVHLTRVYKQYKQTAVLDVRNSCIIPSRRTSTAFYIVQSAACSINKTRNNCFFFNIWCFYF